MEIDFSGLYIDKLIMHEIVRQRVSKEKKPPNYSEIESSLNDEIRFYLKDKITETIGGSRSYEVIFEESTNSPIPKIVEEFLSSDDFDFVSLSKRVAAYLNDIQGGRSPGGLVTVVLGNIQGENVVGILKLEREEGARLKQIQRKGKPTYDISHLRDLILTEKTKLFKIGLFFQYEQKRYHYDGKVCDNQLSYTSEREVADFFLKNFLGCRLATDPKVETKEFFNATQEFFKEHIKDTVVQIRYNIHLLSYISDEGRTLSARRFATSKLDIDHRQKYVDYLRKQGVRTEEIIRDTALIKNRINNIILEFENEIRIIGPEEGFEKRVTLKSLTDGKTRAEIISKIKNINTK